MSLGVLEEGYHEHCMLMELQFCTSEMSRQLHGSKPNRFLKSSRWFLRRARHAFNYYHVCMGDNINSHDSHNNQGGDIITTGDEAVTGLVIRMPGIVDVIKVAVMLGVMYTIVCPPSAIMELVTCI